MTLLSYIILAIPYYQAEVGTDSILVLSISVYFANIAAVWVSQKKFISTVELGLYS